MIRNLALTLVATLGLAGPASADTMHLVLELVSYRDDTPTSRVTLHASDIDPNSYSVDETFRLAIDGRPIDAPRELLFRLDSVRSAFGSIRDTAAIHDGTRQALCLLGGPALGDILSLRALQYDGHQITGSEMKRVLSEQGNCLFTPDIHPVDPAAWRAVTKTLAILQTLRALNP